MAINEGWLDKAPAPKRQHLKAHIEGWNEFGKLWEEDADENIWHDEGEMYLLSCALATALSGYGPTRTSVYIGMDARASLAEADTLADLLTEPTSANGYQRQALTTSGTGAAGQDWVISQPAAAYQAASKTVAFSCSASSWAGLKNMFLTDHATAVATASNAHLLGSLALSATRNINSGESIQINMTLGISE